MTREEAIKVAYGILVTKAQHEALQFLIPELAESEDEKIRKLILGKMEASRKYSNWYSDEEVAWVEKQKDSIPYEKYVEDIATIRAEARTKYHEGWNDGYEARQVINAAGDSGHQAGYVVAMNEMKPKVATATLDSEKQKEQKDKGEISDGYHTFNELYYYRMLYNAAFFNLLPKEWVHKSKRHHDGEECFGGGWFVVMANLPTGQISNHYELKDWDLFQISEKEVADEWDGHTPQEAAERLNKYLQEKHKEQKPVEPSIDELAQDYVDGVKEYNPEPTWDLIQTAVCYGYHYREQKEQKPVEPSIDEPHWKPSEEQLNELHYALVPGYAYNGDVLQGLYADLKKLMEE